MSAADSTLVARQAPLPTDRDDATGLHAVLEDKAAQFADTSRPPESHQELENRLAHSRSPSEIFALLHFAEALPPRSVDLEIEFQALGRLIEADTVFLRGAAYRWLAGLHRKDLRFEMRAKLVLKTGLQRETGIARHRVTQLLRRC